MAHLYFTGDTHGDVINHLNRFRNRSKHLGLTKEDFLIICGDFGCFWDGPDKKQLDWLDDCPWTTLFIDGNHENFVLLEALEEKEMFGGLVGIAGQSIFHLKRGEIYTIAGKKIFTYGGGVSIDKALRVEGISWWPQEIPSKAEEDYALDNLAKHGNKVDIIVTHTMPATAVKEFEEGQTHGLSAKLKDPTVEFLQHVLREIEFTTWFAGHFHVNQYFLDGKLCGLWNTIVELGVDKYHRTC
jgi:hypothetical protein